MKNIMDIKGAKKMIPYLLIIALGFYLLPLLMQNTGLAIIFLLVVIPMNCFICSLMYGMRHSLNVLFPLFVAILFIPTVFIFYNSTAWVYCPGFGFVSLVGNAIGMIIYRLRGR